MKTLLILAYMSLHGVPSIQVHEWHGDMQECRREATKWYSNLKAGTGRAWCVKVPK